MITLTNGQARRFMLLRHGLLGGHKYIGKRGALEFARDTRCIQFDPVDVCGRNAELAMQSRVKGFDKSMLDELLYRDRKLLDYPDKNTSIILTEDWPYFGRSRRAAAARASEHPELLELMRQALAYVSERGAVCADDLKLESDFKWRAFIVWSSGNNLSGSVLEQLYGTGELIIHHKKGSHKYYDITAKHIPNDILSQPEPIPDDGEYKKWRALRLIGAVSLMWRRPSQMWWYGLKSDERHSLFAALEDDGRIIPAAVEGLRDIFYFRSEDLPLMERVLAADIDLKPRCELIAPLDSFMWDRGLIKYLFGFEYSWEIYTPAAKRKYGHYVLPILRGERFIGRVEAVCDRKARALRVKNVWLEPDVKRTAELEKAMGKCFERFAKFNDCETIERES